jgi:hypothetical protein
MAIIEVKVPQLSESVAEATLLDWHKKEGERVSRDENLIDIETDKVVLELPSPSDGVLVKILKKARDSVVREMSSPRSTPRAKLPPPRRLRRSQLLLHRRLQSLQ